MMWEQAVRRASATRRPSQIFYRTVIRLSLRDGTVTKARHCRRFAQLVTELPGMTAARVFVLIRKMNMCAVM